MSKFETMIQGLKKDIKVPEQVWKKYVSTLEQLPDKPAQRTSAISKRRIWPVAAATLVLGVVTVSAAAYFNWSQGLEEGMKPTKEQRQVLQENQTTSFVGQSVTQGNVTVTAYQSIVDNYSAYLSFKVEGYQPKDGEEPGFSGVDVVIGDGNDDYNGEWGASFYNGLIAGPDGRAVHPDGTPLTEDEGVQYILEDGTMEYQIEMTTDKKGYFMNKPIHVQLKDLGVYTEKAGDISVEAEGDWSFDWTLTGNGQQQVFTLNTPLGDTGATVQQIEFSPISVSILYEFPRQEIVETAIDENGEETPHTSFKEPPYFTGVQLKDGTIYTGIAGGGSMGYVDSDSNLYEDIISLTRIIDVDQVASFLFIKSEPTGEQPLTEENLYFVPVQ